jgi:ribosome biogenesis protein BRX1
MGSCVLSVLYADVLLYSIHNAILGVRNYQITEGTERVGGNKTKLIEIGPRMVLVPIRIFSGSMGGVTLYQNPAYISPNDERSMRKKAKG